MTSDDLGNADAFASWRRMLASVEDDAKTAVFANCAHDVARRISRGLDKTTAVDELHAIAAAYGIVEAHGEDMVQTTIADALRSAEAEGPQWDAFDGEKLPVVRPRTNGHAPDEVVVPLPPRLSENEFIQGFVPPDYVVDGIMQRRFIYSLTGQTGHAKTAVALYLAMQVAREDRNGTLGAHKVEYGRVVYFVGENADDVRMRVIGMIHRRDDASARTITFIPGTFKIEAMIPVLAAEAKAHGEPTLIVVDTSAAYFGGDDEQSNTQMGNYARMLRTLTGLPGGPCVLVLCHPIKHVTEPWQLKPRGGSAFLNEMDGGLTLWRDGELATLDRDNDKFRGPGFQPIAFELVKVEKTPGLTDTKGRPITTVHAAPITNAEEETATKAHREKEDRVLAAMLKNPEGSLARWATDLGWMRKDEPEKKTVENAINRLYKNKPALIRKNRDAWELTDEGKVQARKAAQRFDQQRLAAAQNTLFDR